VASALLLAIITWISVPSSLSRNARSCSAVNVRWRPAATGSGLVVRSTFPNIVGVEYGTLVGDRSITHAEYCRAKERRLPVLAFIKGNRHVEREEGTTALLAEIEDDGFKYKRTGNVIDLQREVRSALVNLLEERFRIAPTSDENDIARQTIEATSPFESRHLERAAWRTPWRTVP